MQKIGRAQADFFREMDGAYEYLCRARAVHDVITSKFLTFWLLRRSYQTQQLQQLHLCIRRRHLYIHYFRLLSKTFDL